MSKPWTVYKTRNSQFPYALRSPQCDQPLEEIMAGHPCYTSSDRTHLYRGCDAYFYEHNALLNGSSQAMLTESPLRTVGFTSYATSDQIHQAIIQDLLKEIQRLSPSNYLVAKTYEELYAENQQNPTNKENN